MDVLVDVNGIIVNVLLGVLTLVITSVGGFLTAFIKSKLNANQLELLDNITANVVLAVEQSTYGKELAGDATAKKELALNALESLLKKYGITLTADQMDTAIEAAVANVLNANKLVEPPKMIEVDGPTDSGFIG